MVWIPEDVVWAKAYQLCGPERDATPFWRAARQILEAQERLVLADQRVQESESRTQRAEQILQDAESRSLTAEQTLREAQQKIHTLESALATQRSSSTNRTVSPNLSPPPPPPERSNLLMLALGTAFIAVLGLTFSVVIPVVLPGSSGIERGSE